MFCTRERICCDIQTLLNYVGGSFRFGNNKPFIHKDSDLMENCFSVALGEDCFVAFDGYKNPIFMDALTYTDLLTILNVLYKSIKISDLAKPYADMENFFCWSFIRGINAINKAILWRVKWICM